MDGAIEVLHCADALKGCIIRCAKVLNPHYIDGKAVEPGQAVLIDISCPASLDCSQPGSMGNIKKAADFMLQCMGGKVTSGVSAAGKSIVGKAAGP